MLDIDVPAIIQPWATITAPGQICDQLCATTLGAYSGAEIIAGLFGGPISTVPKLLAGYQPIDVAQGLQRRGCVVLNSAGRVGVTLGKGTVLEAAGRVWAITADPATRWAGAYLIPGVLYTMELV